MSEHDNDNISRFFRKASRKPNIRFEESDWEKLEARLDAARNEPAPTVGRNHWKSAFFVAAALLFVSSSLLFYKGRKDNLAQERTSHEKTITSTLPITTSSKKNERTTQFSLQPDVRRKESKVKIANSLTTFREDLTTPQDDVIADNKDVRTTTIDEQVNYTSVASSPEVIDESPMRDSSVVKNQKKFLPKEEITLKDSTTEEEKPKLPRWNIMLSLSPDFSSTGLHEFTVPGEALGIAAYYNLNSSFSISAGVVKSNKIYWDHGNEYKPVQSDFWNKRTNGIVPDKIEGTCSVLEIPLGLQYSTAFTKKSKIYVAASLSSYIMLAESYKYVFDSPNPGAMNNWDARKATYSLFNNANLSVGYERSLSHRVMLGVSPYFKIPLSGIGSWADVKLYSMGAAFTLRYQFQKKKSPTG